jgi:DNA-binding beta-propeller fold protein YncE
MRTIIRVIGIPLCGVLLAAGALQSRSDEAPYTQVAKVPSVYDGQKFYSFAFDPVDRRLYAASEQGGFWVDLRDREPRIKGPLFRKRIDTIEVAPEAGRLFYTTLDEFGYVNLRTNDPPQRLAGRQWRTARLAYEPTRREMYIATRENGIVVYNTDSGERGPVIELPGWYPTMLEAVPGKVFFSVANHSGLFVIDAATHAVTSWPVDGPLVTPAYLDADPTGQYLFATYDRHVVAIDVASAKVVGRRSTAGGARIAFDPDRRLLIVSEYDRPGHPLIRLRAFAVGADGLTEVAELKNPADGQVGLESFRGGFLQEGHRSLLLWSTSAAGTH